MSERLTEPQQEEWDRWIARALPYLLEGFSSSVADTLLVAVDAELRALRAELAEAQQELIRVEAEAKANACDGQADCDFVRDAERGIDNLRDELAEAQRIEQATSDMYFGIRSDYDDMVEERDILGAELAEAQRQLRLRCFEAYQMAGALEPMPGELLDYLSAGMRGVPLPPDDEPDDEEIT